MLHWPRLVGAIACAAALASCDRGSTQTRARPSVLIAVLDTTRMDAVSAYGFVRDTTPSFDALAREGVLYEWALAPAPWTLPSHATLFTSLGPERHGVGVAGRMALGTGHATLAERLSSAGYETIGFSENPIVGRQTGLGRGFDHFEGESDAVNVRSSPNPANTGTRFDVVRGIQRWAELRADPDRPFFVFVNLFDPHDPYRPDERYLRVAEADRAEAERIARTPAVRGIAEAEGICDRLPPLHELEILRALYLGEVSAADAKLGRIHELLEETARGGLITVVAADHGEHLGEHRLLGHEFSLHAELLRVPLVVHGLPGARRAVIETPVGLGDIAPSVLGWLGVEAPVAWSAERLPLADAPTAEPRAFRGLYADAALVAPEGMSTNHEEQMSRRRRGCSAQDRVFGEILSLVRFPFKLVWYERHPAQLYDLRWDERELSDLSSHEPARVAALRAEVEKWRAELEGAAAGPAAPVSEATLETLRALGYLE